MKFPILEGKLLELTDKFTKELQQELVDKNHIKTGNLYRSIKFRFKKDNSTYTLELDCLEYMTTLEGGKFIKDFMAKKRIEMKEVIKKNIIIDIKNTFIKK